MNHLLFHCYAQLPIQRSLQQNQNYLTFYNIEIIKSSFLAYSHSKLVLFYSNQYSGYRLLFGWKLTAEQKRHLLNKRDITRRMRNGKSTELSMK